MIVVIKRPGQLAERAEIGESLETMQAVIGGYVEVALNDREGPSDTVWCAMWCDEEGLLKPDKLPCVRRPTDGHVIVGTVVVTGMRMTTDGAAWCSIPEDAIGRWRLSLDVWSVTNDFPSYPTNN